MGVLTGAAVGAPRGFRTHVASVGIKDASDDFMILASERPCAADAVFTRSLFAGPSVVLSRRHLAESPPRAVVAVSKNANVATGEQGLRNAEELATGAAAIAGCAPAEVLVASTGVIGRQYPMERLRAHLASRPVLRPADLQAAARAIMTTDTVPKLAAARAGDALVAGIAKGVGMIEPDMATMLAFLCSDAAVPPEVLRAAFRRVVDRTFNCLSIDTDTSTSDTAVLLANGAAGPVDATEFERALHAVCESLARQLARDGEGATKLIEVTVSGASDPAQARRVAKAVVNSPLVKTAVHGADPNWGRVAMAIGKCSDDTDVHPDRVRISFAGIEVYAGTPTDPDLDKLRALLRHDEVPIAITLGTGDATATVWGCDLSRGYITINADYTT